MVGVVVCTEKENVGIISVSLLFRDCTIFSGMDQSHLGFDSQSRNTFGRAGFGCVNTCLSASVVDDFLLRLSARTTAFVDTLGRWEM